MGKAKGIWKGKPWNSRVRQQGWRPNRGVAEHKRGSKGDRSYDTDNSQIVKKRIAWTAEKSQGDIFLSSV